MKKVVLKNSSKFALVDDADYELLKDYNWIFLKAGNKEYAVARVRLIKGKYQPLGSQSEIAKKRRKNTHQRFKVGLFYPPNSLFNLTMHRFLMKAPKEKQVDHINGNGLDNQRLNLRLCTRAENGRNRKLSTLNTSGYYGVSYQATEKRKKRWLAMLRIYDKRIYLGRFYTKEEAAHVYNVAAKKHHGKFASLNILP